MCFQTETLVIASKQILCPTATAHPDVSFKHILCPLDFSSSAMQALGFALDLD